MGCCSSTAAGNSPIQKHSKHKHSRNLQQSNPLPEEEESVKEVLSETPTIPRAFRKSKELRKIPYSFPKGLNPDGKYQLDGFLKNPPPPSANSEDVSEACSAQSECLSSASIFTDYNELDNNDPEEIRRRRSPLKMRDRSASSGDFGRRGKSPRAKIMNPSPNRVRSVTPNSGRRSVSPATMRNGTVQGTKKGLGRSVSAGRTRSGMYSDRVKAETGGLSYKEDHWPPPPPPPPPTNDDSLENPFVALECFIFL